MPQSIVELSVRNVSGSENRDARHANYGVQIWIKSFERMRHRQRGKLRERLQGKTLMKLLHLIKRQNDAFAHSRNCTAGIRSVNIVFCEFRQFNNLTK